MNQEVIAYRKHMNIKLAAAQLGVAWQSLYVRLKQLGEPVTGDKMRYGSDRDKLAAMAEAKFLQLVPFAVDNSVERRLIVENADMRVLVGEIRDALAYFDRVKEMEAKRC